MIKVFNKSKVYVCCFRHIITGGVELAHQLVSVLNDNNVDAYVVYVDDKGDIVNADIPKEYAQYNVKVSSTIENNTKNVLVMFEAVFHIYRRFKKCQLIFWWLSVDNFYTCSSHFLSLKDYFKRGIKEGFYQFFKRIYRLIVKQKNTFTGNFSLKELSKTNSLNCYQSVYAQQFLLKHNFSEVLPLSDYIHTDFTPDRNKISREDKILYNPKKGLAFTQKIQKATPHLKWVKLQGMSRAELQEQFQTSKLYIDFGNHPGKDRIPREAAINGCCVLTNQRGSAKYFEDIAIPRKFKINDSKISRKEIINKIEEVLVDYNSCNKEFEFYRKRILEEKSIFESQVKHIFNIEDVSIDESVSVLEILKFEPF